ncbi:MAG TPA: UDP-4-amino-4,6-dideoxy-N-acetyl-beta-L-altrosamine transaminase [Rhizomicrobium sp.]|nr:UDP-4-amino-4,6-dideoxy-N-acetyl-beta-L-altrosamine transaminase [Rhizomicrobium sp.]
MSVPAARRKRTESPLSKRILPYGRQVVEEDDVAVVAEALRGDYLTTGPYVGRFEARLAETVGAEHAVVCANGTAALHMAARALDIGPGARVVVPAITFLATASAPHLAGADVIFADVDPLSGLMRPEDLESALGRAGPIDAVFNVHLNGQCGEIESIAKIARAHGAKIVDDACHALGTGFVAADGSVAGVGDNRFCDASVFSFHPVKAIAMGEGGAVTTNDAEVASRLMLARNHGMTREPERFENAHDAFDENGNPNPWYYELVEPEFNWRASDIQCALGFSQLGKLGRFIARRRALAAFYDTKLASLAPALRPVARTRCALPAWHLYAVLIDFERAAISRARLMRSLAERGVGTQVHYYPVYRQPYYAALHDAGPLAGADAYYAKVLSLPLFASMTEADVDFVVETLTDCLFGR